MVTFIPRSVKLWGKGQLTIPKEMREALRLDESNQLNIFVVGRSLIMTPKTLLRSSLAKETQKTAKGQGIQLKDLLSGLKKERRRYNREKHGG